LDDLPYQVTPFDWYNNMFITTDYSLQSAALLAGSDFLPQEAHTFSGSYYGWDSMKTRGCVCDPEWGDVDCSKRMCDYGTDIMDHRPNTGDTQLYHTQLIQFQLNSAVATAQNGQTFALTFKSKLNETFTTNPIVWNYHSSLGTAASYAELSEDIQAALEALPNRVVDGVSVTTEARLLANGAVSPIGTFITIQVTFNGDHVQGAQNLLVMRNYQCLDGCTPKLTGLELVPGTLAVTVVHTLNGATSAYESADYNSYECGRRGKCNYDTGVCQCFAGYTGLACNTITALV